MKNQRKYLANNQYGGTIRLGAWPCRINKDTVLEKMHEFGYITEKEKEVAQKFKFEFAQPATKIKAPHFTLAVQEYLTEKYGEEFIRTSGLNVLTTLDWDLQQIAEKAVLDGANRNTEIYKGHNAALIAQDATTGQIIAMVGSKDYFGEPELENCHPGLNCKFEGNFNVSTQGLRQPGSAMKPFAYISAFKKGFSPDTVVFDVPTEFAAANPKCPTIVDFSNEEKECFHPQNFDENFRGPVKLRTALAQSINVPAAKVLYLAGIDNTLKLAQEFGLSTLTERSRYGLSLVLGGGEVVLKDLVGAYSVFAQEGLKHKQVMVLKITDSKNNIVEEYKDSSSQIIDPQYPRLINDILTDIDERAGLFSSSLQLTIFPGHQVALKTGTTNDYRDAWAMGYTPDLVVGVWSGNNDNSPMERHGSSILAAIPIWSNFMGEALKNRPLISFNKPDSILNQKSMLRGEYVVNYKFGDQAYPQIHNILYYTDKNEPAGPQPPNPDNDSQFENWETPVLRWAEQIIPNFSLVYNHPVPAGAQTESDISEFKSTINIISPKNGAFINTENISVAAEFNTLNDIKNIELFFNNELMDQRFGNFGKSFVYQFNLLTKKTELQNSLKIKILDVLNKELSKDVILYK